MKQNLRKPSCKCDNLWSDGHHYKISTIANLCGASLSLVRCLLGSDSDVRPDTARCVPPHHSNPDCSSGIGVTVRWSLPSQPPCQHPSLSPDPSQPLSGQSVMTNGCRYYSQSQIGKERGETT